MIEGNIIKFGYGDVMAASNDWGYIKFTNIKPPQKCGVLITDELYEHLEIGLSIEIHEDNPFDLYNIIKTVNENHTIVQYKDIIFDFSNFNTDSVKTVLSKAKEMVNMRFLAV